jgi:hypothetical protein
MLSEGVAAKMGNVIETSAAAAQGAKQHISSYFLILTQVNLDKNHKTKKPEKGGGLKKIPQPHMPQQRGTPGSKKKKHDIAEIVYSRLAVVNGTTPLCFE